LLRIYWYDGTSTGPTAQHLELAHLSDVKVRLGFVNSFGEQKGVDSLIITDMIALARNRSIADAVLLSGDEDLRVGVQQAQEFGIRVHLVGIKPSRGSQSLFLLQEADTTHEWSEAKVAAFLSCKLKESVPVKAAVQPAKEKTGPATPLEKVPKEVAAKLSLSELQSILDASESANQIPRDIDAQLLAGTRRLVGHQLGPDEKEQVRKNFVDACKRRIESV
jgi:hypothetical protein